MSDVEGYYFPAKLWPDQLDMLRDYKDGQLSPHSQLDNRVDDSWRSPVLVCLMEDLSSHLPVNAMTLAFDPALPVTHDVSLVGEVRNSSATIQLRIKPDQEDDTEIENSPEIPWDATAIEVRDLIKEMQAFQGYRLAVSLGNISTPDNDYPLGRWLISTNNLQASFSTPSIDSTTNALDVTVKTCRLKQTGYIRKVCNPLPVGDPTPLRVGAICWAYPVDSFGFVVLSAEPRQFNIDIPDEEL